MNKLYPSDVEALRQRVAELEEVRKAHIAQFNALKDELKSIGQALDDPRTDLSMTMVEVIQDMKQQLAAVEKERDALKLDAAIGRVPLDSKDFAWEERLAACEKELLIRDKKIQDLVAENTSLDDKLAASQQRISELEATIRQHGIPVKTYAGGEAHYVMGEPK
jgi:chromosome segregation ATPase